ncbi:hypothetical protein [Mucilaginibacter sp.]
MFFIVLTYLASLRSKNQFSDIDSYLESYVISVLIEIVCSVFTMFIFWAFVEFSITFNIPPLLRQWFIFFVGIFLTIGTSSLLQSPFIIDDFFFVAMICNTTCIGMCIWVYTPLV